MNTQHTPGPWHVGGKGSAAAVVGKVDDDLRVWAYDTAGVAEILIRKSIYEKGPSKEMLANARLIAAAPDLLAALIDAENMLDQLRHTRVLENDTWDAIDKTVDKARAAIAKAEGV